LGAEKIARRLFASEHLEDVPREMLFDPPMTRTG
jgi:hypothetical protein